MSNAFTKLSQDKLNASVAGLLCPRIEAILGDRGPGHCMRVTDLDDDVMESVCKELRRTRPDGNIFILGGHEQEGMSFRVTSTKLVELRNPDANGELRQIGVVEEKLLVSNELQLRIGPANLPTKLARPLQSHAAGESLYLPTRGGLLMNKVCGITSCGLKKIEQGKVGPGLHFDHPRR